MSTIFYWQRSEQLASTLLTLACLQCESPLTIHQPDPELPHRLLATCEECKSWFLANPQGLASAALPVIPENRALPGLAG
jgi:hypothetical protein